MLAFFGMELAGVEVIFPDHGREGDAVVGAGGDDRFVAGPNIVRVNKVNARAIWQTGEDRGRADDIDFIPTHMRHLERLAGEMVGDGVESHDIAAKDTEPFVDSILMAAIEKELQAQTDSEHRSAFGVVIAKGIVESHFFQVSDRITKSTDARQNQAVGREDLFRARGNECAMPDMLDGFGNASQVSHSVVNNGDGIHAWSVLASIMLLGCNLQSCRVGAWFAVLWIRSGICRSSIGPTNTLDAVVVGIDDVKPAGGIDPEGPRIPKFADVSARLAPDAQRLSLFIESLDSTVAELTDVDGAVWRQGDIVGVHHFTRLGARMAEL